MGSNLLKLRSRYLLDNNNIATAAGKIATNADTYIIQNQIFKIKKLI